MGNMRANVRPTCVQRRAAPRHLHSDLCERAAQDVAKEYGEREMTADEARAFFTEGETELLGGFKSKKGRFFKAKLILKPNGRHGFEFAPRR